MSDSSFFFCPFGPNPFTNEWSSVSSIVNKSKLEIFFHKIPVINRTLESSMESTSILNERFVTIDEQKRKGTKSMVTVF